MSGRRSRFVRAITQCRRHVPGNGIFVFGYSAPSTAIAADVAVTYRADTVVRRHGTVADNSPRVLSRSFLRLLCYTAARDGQSTCVNHAGKVCLCRRHILYRSTRRYGRFRGSFVSSRHFRHILAPANRYATAGSRACAPNFNAIFIKNPISNQHSVCRGF